MIISVECKVLASKNTYFFSIKNVVSCRNRELDTSNFCPQLNSKRL